MGEGLSWNHDVVRCHEATEMQRNLICKLKRLACCIDTCDRYQKATHELGEPFPPDWAVPLITYPMSRPRECDLFDAEFQPEPPPKDNILKIKGGRRINRCICGKRDGLQADCELPECTDNELCLIKPYPLCIPSGNAEMCVTPCQAERLLSYLSPPDYSSYYGSECKENEACSPKCLECNATLRDICRWNPRFLRGNSLCNYNPNPAIMAGSYNNCLSPCYTQCYPYASWCYSGYPGC
ncbi:uncharacterized protein LOC106670092 [Cimex lectularius]|uniref:Uncharacterized protein n=1 Tax=Cimex lectularius TaxID=79782 RepID=A0A8I6TJH6_CIMLE|nr:uncharacterized protein LOC106670092 [Cimex lectularius]